MVRRPFCQFCHPAILQFSNPAILQFCNSSVFYVATGREPGLITGSPFAQRGH